MAHQVSAAQAAKYGVKGRNVHRVAAVSTYKRQLSAQIEADNDILVSAAQRLQRLTGHDRFDFYAAVLPNGKTVLMTNTPTGLVPASNYSLLSKATLTYVERKARRIPDLNYWRTYATTYGPNQLTFAELQAAGIKV